uniref:Hypotheticial protein n=1 Tax=Schistosoma japonicum TaxID=6182 RepID=C7TYQ3_SCHJA|nr:hypotheticial protein [Schistosoma japonicum]
MNTINMFFLATFVISVILTVEVHTSAKQLSNEISKEKVSSCSRQYDTCANEYRACWKNYNRCLWSCSDDCRKNSSIITDSSTVTDPPALTKCYIACEDKCRSENKGCVDYDKACKDVCSKEFYYCLKDK